MRRSLVSVVLAAGLLAGCADSPDPAALGSDAIAEVHRAALQPHQGYARAVYALTGYTVEYTGDDGTREQRFEAGEAHARDAGDHTVEDAGDAVAEFLVVEFKR